MAVTTKVLMQARSLNALNTSYAPSGVTTIIDKMTIRNFSASPAGVTVRILERYTAGSDYNIVAQKVLAVGETYTFPEVVGQVLMNGDILYVQPYVNDTLGLRVCGREINI